MPSSQAKLFLLRRALAQRVPANEADTPSSEHEGRYIGIHDRTGSGAASPAIANTHDGLAALWRYRHRLGAPAQGLPCQDAVAFHQSQRPILALSDGAGSAAISERGAQALVIGVTRLLRTMEDDLSPWLDGEDDASQAQSTRWAERLRLHAKGLLADLASAERHAMCVTMRATLQVAVIGERHIFWWK